MTILHNLRRVVIDGTLGMAADFTGPGGRVGSVTVSLSEYEAYGEVLLLDQARARVLQVSRDGYQPPEADRYRELG